ncbi:MAG: VOC family protein [Armatimonadota bacterium]|nr:VOC family protein [Armatimonadota bacterium]MDR7484775.1 VOC family protein [Armatimonadota bacterium]MDR7534765.1 VOC family protein [Armatimonadota bacterium]
MSDGAGGPPGAPGLPLVRGVHHLGILVRDARAAAARFARLGLEVAAWEEYGPGLLRIGFIPAGDVLLELIEPLGTEDFTARWVRQRGEGLQHIAFQVDDLGAVLARLRAQGVPLQDEAPRPGAANTLIAFLAAEVAEGFLVELTQPLGPWPWTTRP